MINDLKANLQNKIINAISCVINFTYFLLCFIIAFFIAYYEL